MKKIGSLFKKVLSIFKIDSSFFVMLLLFLILDDVCFYILYLIFLILHETSHLLVAKHFGYLPNKLKLTAFGASLEGFDDFLIDDELKIILAGPLFNLCVVIVCYLSFWFYPESYCFLNRVLEVNLSIFFFNILPIFPLDAGRLLLCLVSKRVGRIKGVNIVKKISLVLIFVMFFISIFSFFVYFNFSIGFVAINLCLLLFDSTAGTSYKREVVLYKKIKRLNRGVPKKTVFIKENFSEPMLLKFIDGEHYFIFVFVDENFSVKREIDEYNLLLNLGFI